jgi:hypothetical protein
LSVSIRDAIERTACEQLEQDHAECKQSARSSA